MSAPTNDYQQPLGEPVPGWTPRLRPSGTTLEGRYARLERLDATRHASQLHHAYSQAADGRAWTYLSVGPFADEQSYYAYVQEICDGSDPLHFAVIDRLTQRALGTLALMRIDAKFGVIEVGHVNFSVLMQRTPLATEAQYLLMTHIFDELKYRRYEWKCDSLNAPSRRAAERLGFSFEGIFRQAVIYKGRSRDTAWYSIIDREWPALRGAFQEWLAAENFGAAGHQRRSLAQVRGAESVPMAEQAR